MDTETFKALVAKGQELRREFDKATRFVKIGPFGVEPAAPTRKNKK